MLTPGHLDHLNRQVVATAVYLVKRARGVTVPRVTAAIVAYALIGFTWFAID